MDIYVGIVQNSLDGVVAEVDAILISIPPCTLRRLAHHRHDAAISLRIAGIMY